MDDLSDNELGFITNSLGLETNSLFNDELNLNSISHDYIKNEDDLFLTNDENWLSSLDNVNSFNHHSTSLTNINQIINQNCSINNNHNLTDQESINHSRTTINQTNEIINLHNQNLLLVKKKRKLNGDLCDHSNASFINGLLKNDVQNVIEISDLGTNQRNLKSISPDYNNVVIKTENLDLIDEQLKKKSDKVNLNKKASKLLGKPIKHETDVSFNQKSIFNNERENSDDYASDQEEIENDFDEDEEIDELLKFPVNSSILEDQCGSPAELHQLNNLIHDSDSGSSHFDDGYLSSATSINFNLANLTNNQLLNENRRQSKVNVSLLTNNQTSSSSSNDQLYQVHNYSCIKQDKFLHSANNQLINGNQQLITNGGSQLICLKHKDDVLNSNYPSSNSSLSGGSNSSSPTQSPNTRKSNFGRRQQQVKSTAVNADDQTTKIGLRSNNSSTNNNLKVQQQTGSGRGSRSKPITDLHLTDEERRLLNKEGYHDFPAGDNPQLTKMEEKILRKIRRKIRNKRSAQFSRQRKKAYLEELEQKYSKSTDEVQCLKGEVLKLRRENISLISKLQKLMRSADNNMPQINLSEDQMTTNCNNSLSDVINDELPEICDLTAWTQIA